MARFTVDWFDKNILQVHMLIFESFRMSLFRIMFCCLKCNLVKNFYVFLEILVQYSLRKSGIFKNVTFLAEFSRDLAHFLAKKKVSLKLDMLVLKWVWSVGRSAKENR